jgi:tRNA G18 (ribose-2'-O)-methylase SpoU
MAGITPTPDHPRVAKTALGASQSVSFSYHRNGLNQILELKKQGWKIWSLENRLVSDSIFSIRKLDPMQEILLVVGNELAGIDPSILDESDRVFNLPMQGSKESLNVSVAFGIAIYWLRNIQEISSEC